VTFSPLALVSSHEFRTQYLTMSRKRVISDQISAIRRQQ